MPNNLFLSKKANIMGLGWFLSIIIAGVGISLVMVSFFSTALDVRRYEAEILNNKARDCISEKGVGVLGDNFLENCGFNKESFGEGTNFFIGIYTDEAGILKDYKYGNNAIEKNCELKLSGVSGEKIPDCAQGSLVIYDSEKKENIRIKFISGSKNQGQTIK